MPDQDPRLNWITESWNIALGTFVEKQQDLAALGKKVLPLFEVDDAFEIYILNMVFSRLCESKDRDIRVKSLDIVPDWSIVLHWLTKINTIFSETLTLTIIRCACMSISQ